MRAVPLPDQLYSQAESAAAAFGLSVETFVADAVKRHLADDPSDLDGRFTPEVVAALDRSSRQADAGRVIGFDEYEERLRAKREAWLSEQ